MGTTEMKVLSEAVLALIRAHELERAQAMVEAAAGRHETASYSGRSVVVHELNHAILAAKRARDDMRREASLLAGGNEVDVNQRLIEPLDRLMEREIERLKAEKRRVSRP